MTIALLAALQGRDIEPAKVWKPADGKPGIRLIRSKEEWPGGPEIDYSAWAVVVIVQGVVLDSEKARLASVREFDDRVELTYATRGALCGSEPSVFDALCVQLPRSSKPLVVRHARTSVPRGLTVSTAAEFPR